MMRTGILYFSLILVIVGCNQASDRPGKLLSRKEMVPIIYGLMLTDEYSGLMLNRDSSLNLKGIRTEKYSEVFRIYNTDHKAFIDSYNYYLGRPPELKAIYDSVEATATRKRIETISPSTRPQEIKIDRKKLVRPE